MAREYEFYLDKVLLPVTPAKVQMKIKNHNKTVTLINDGEINLLKRAGLTEISFVAEFPNVIYPYARYKSGFQNAAYYLEQLEKLKTDTDAKGKLKPFQFIISRMFPDGKPLFDTNIKVSLEDYRPVEESNNGMDVKVEILLKMFRDYGTKTIQINDEQDSSSEPPKAEIKQERPAETAPKLKSYTAVAGDSLWSIAQKYLGDGNRYSEIYALNQALIDSQNEGTGNPKHTIYPEQIFMLPL